MAGIVTNIVQNSLAGFVGGAVTTIGGYAGSAVNGVGNLIENGGRTIGDGISKTFEGWGESVNAYGTAARNATAPNAGSYTSVKKVDSKSKPASKVGEKKALPSTAERKALPSTKPMKALPAPPAKKDVTDVTTSSKPKSSYQPVGDVKSKAGSVAGTARKTELPKPKTNGSGKVVPSQQSLPKTNLKAKPAQKPSTPSTYPKASSVNLPASASPKPAAVSYGSANKTLSKAGSVAGGQQKNLAIPGFGLPDGKPAAKAPSQAPSVVNKASMKPPPSKAGSIAGSYSAGGPKFF